MKRLLKRVDAGSMLTIVITLILFVAALFVKGFTHGLLLEAGVFLVSVKLILLGYKHGVQGEALERDLAEIKRLLQQDEPGSRGGKGSQD